MAKFNIEVELDWLHEDCETTIDDELKVAIMEQITAKTVSALTKSMQGEVDKLMNAKIGEFSAAIDEKLNSLLTDFFETPRDITDKWGHVKRHGVTANQLLSEACDKFMTEMVDENGKTDSYGTKCTRIEHIVKKAIERDVTWAIDSAVKNAVDMVKTKVKNAATKQLGEKMAEVVGLEKIIF